MPPAPLEDPDDDFWADPRCGELIEQAEDLQLSGDHESAIELLDQAVEIPGIEAGYAMASRAFSLFTLGQHSDARSQLNTLRKHKPFSAMAFHQAAEAAAQHGELKLALRWYDMGVSRLTDLLEDGGFEFELGPKVTVLAIGRAQVRRTLGLDPDELDRTVSPQPPMARPGSLASGEVGPESIVRVLFWHRDEIRPAAARWPTLLQHTDIDEVLSERELENRELVARDGARVVMVPLTVDLLAEFSARTGGDPLDGRTRTKFLHEQYDKGAVIQWPPGRNDPCWCGSLRKYKNCCARSGESGRSTCRRFTFSREVKVPLRQVDPTPGGLNKCKGRRRRIPVDAPYPPRLMPLVCTGARR